MSSLQDQIKDLEVYQFLEKLPADQNETNMKVGESKLINKAQNRICRMNYEIQRQAHDNEAFALLQKLK